jgi:uncharacterized protein YfaS (alpha-2-macroglobulin family)
MRIEMTFQPVRPERRIPSRVLGICVVVAIFASSPASGRSRDAQWKKVDDALQKGLPKTAIAELQPILSSALKEKAYAEATKALGMKIAVEGSIEGNKPEERIFRLQAEIPKAPVRMRPTLEAILAHWYWQYFQENRWRFQSRTATAVAPGPNLQTWDLPRILVAIDAHFTAALADEATLKATPISAFDALLVRGSAPDAYRPTLFDFLAHEALGFYVAGEQAGAAAEDAFVLSADSPIFSPTAQFMQWHPESTEENSPTLGAIRLYQKLLAFHRDDRDKSAFADVDLERLDFGHNKAEGEEKEERYKAALQRFAEQWSEHEISARALAEWSEVLVQEDRQVEAHQAAQRGLDAFPKSTGGAMCFNLIQQIEAKSASIRTEAVWNDPLPSIDVTYRNVTAVFFRIVAYDFDAGSAPGHWTWYELDDAKRRELLNRMPVREWSADVPPTADYKQRTQELPAPKGLEPGFYLLFASHDPSFAGADSPVSVASFWVSDLALVIRQRSFEGAIEGFVLMAGTGVPVGGARVQTWRIDDAGKMWPGEPTTTDGNGMFRFTALIRPVILLAQHGRQRLATTSPLGAFAETPEGAQDRTVFFTDRSLYRPGQTIYYKGIQFHVDPTRNEYRPLAGAGVTVTFYDTNGKEITHATHRCNDYGSFDGAFTAPRDRLTGVMTLRGGNGGTSFNVEEYKRPKFQVELGAPKHPAKLDAAVVVPGRATSYTGAAIGGAKVKWRVVRDVRFPIWWWDWRGYGRPRGESQAIAHGTVTTENDGSFAIQFVARPDRSVPKTDEPTFEYHVYADVTDATGETRTDDRLVRIGYTALQASLAAGEWQTPAEPVQLAIETASLDGEPRAAHGSLKVYRLQQPARVLRGPLEGAHQLPVDLVGLRPGRTYHGGRAEPEASLDPSDPNSWDLDQLVSEKSFQTDAAGRTKVAVALKSGIYRAMLETADPFDRPVHARFQFQVVDPKAARFPTKIPNHFTAEKWQVEPGERFQALWGTGYDSGRAFVEIEHAGKRLRASWTPRGRTQAIVKQAVGEEMRGGFTVRVTYVRENRAYITERVVDVPWSNKNLTVKWEHFRSKLDPGKKETWTATISGPDSGRAVAEMVAGLYDASLDQLQAHEWTRSFDVFRRERDWVRSYFFNSELHLQQVLGSWKQKGGRNVDWSYRAFPPVILADWLYVRALAIRAGRPGRIPVGTTGTLMLPPESVNLPESEAFAVAMPKADLSTGALHTGPEEGQAPRPDLAKVSARKNLQETAFFFPHLLTDRQGRVKMEFTMPEALTEWKFLGFAHDRQLRSGFLTDRAVTAKDLMVEPNPPRFVREGDVIEFTVKVSNQTDERQAGRVELTLADAATLRPMDAALGNARKELDFDVPERQTRTYSWRLTVPDGCDFLSYKAVGASSLLSDGEEGFLPVLSRRILVTESLPLPIRGAQTRQFEFTKLVESGKSTTLRQQSLVLQMVSHPAWYAVMALPYLMEFPHACSEQIFNRLYANSLARYIATSDPKIRRIFDLWKGTPALDSPLEKNQDLKAVMLEETPWYQQAQAESQARRNVGVLFDANRLGEETGRALNQLAEMQSDSGLWPWFPGGPPNQYITLYIVTGFGRLRHLGVDVDVASAVKALGALDAWMDGEYRRILAEGHKEQNHLGYTEALYLYGRSFFLMDQPVAKERSEALEYWFGQARKYWLELDSRQSQAHLALGLWRFGDKQTPAAIIRSLKERSVSDPELGMFWRDTESSWWWYQAPVETQAMMIEAFADVAKDTSAVENCKVWLLKQKQTQDWKTTKATADAIYALLLHGTGMLASDVPVEVALAGKPIEPEKVEAGTGFYEERFTHGDIRPEMGHITVRKRDPGVSWGSLHWQYLEDMAKVTPYAGTPLRLEKKLFRKDTTRKGQVLQPLAGPLEVGDELVVRIELRTDRDMEYVHLEDQRGSGTEPVNVLSQYKYQDGLGYYESTRDTASHFFIDYLRKGVYVFEYSTRIQHKGKYQTGVASIQSMYAPEFNSHSQSFVLDVK